MKYPEVRIKNAWLLREATSVYLHELWGKKGEELVDYEKIEEIVKRYRKAWKPEEEKIIKAMCKSVDLEFYQNTIDVYIAPWFQAFSDPLVIGVAYDDETFVDLLTHEICHHLLTDNTIISEKRLAVLDTEWRHLFGPSHSFDTLIHIPVHAICKYIYLDVRKRPDRLKADIALNEKYSAKDYIDAWNYVEEHGYKEIITQLKTSYKTLSKA